MSSRVGQYIYIKSEDKIFSSDTSSNFSINLNENVDNADDLLIQVQNLTIPASWNTINFNNNTITIGPTGTNTFTLTSGVYSTSTLLPELYTQSLGVSGITGTYSSTTGLFSLHTIDLSPWTITTTAKQGFLGLSTGT